MSSKSNLLATAPGIDNASSHARSAGGLTDHLRHNQTHQGFDTIDSYQMPTKFDLSPTKTGVYRGPELHQDSAELVNHLLLKNQQDHHVYFTDTGGFHNHTAHHLLSAWALGATPADLRLAYSTVEGYQRPRFPVEKSRIDEMRGAEGFKSMLGDGRQFHNFLVFFLQKFQENGWKEVTTEYLFSGTEIADDLFVRLFAGIWHNLILVGYGIEFEQPGTVAEGLAGACVHSNAFGPYLLECEQIARMSRAPCKPLNDLLQEIRDDPALCDKAHWKGGNSFAYDDNVSSNAPPGMARLASQWKIDQPDELPYRVAEMINVNAFIAGGAQRPDKIVKIDFIYVHQINAAIFFSAFRQQDWVSQAAKTRLVEWYGRMNLLFYAGSLAPPLFASEITSYKASKPQSTWSSIIHRCLALPDDGHVAKMIRALAHGEEMSKPWESDDVQKDRPSLPMKGGMWLQVANMAIDSTEAEPDLIRRWLRGAGSDEAWAEFPDRGT